MKKKSAFSLFEISIVLLVISILLIGLIKGSSLIGSFNVMNAAKLTKSSVVGKIDGLTLWLETTSAESFDHIEASDGQKVSVWNDISESSTAAKNAQQLNDDNKPTYITNAINGLPVLKFNGSNFMTLPSASSMGIGNLDYELFFVYKGSADIQFLLAGGYEKHEIHFSSNSIRFIPTSGVFVDILPLNFNPTSNHIISSRVELLSNCNGASNTHCAIIRSDGVDTKNGLRRPVLSSASEDVDPLVIGRRSNGTLSMNGYIAEIIMFNRSLSNQERQDVEAYLSKKWGIVLN